jgi:hypothetical protein
LLDKYSKIAAFFWVAQKNFSSIYTYQSDMVIGQSSIVTHASLIGMHALVRKSFTSIYVAGE